MAVGQQGWATKTEADSYFANERHVSTLWNALTDDGKNKALNMAYNRLYYSEEFSLPAKGAETAAQHIVLVKGQSEMVYYLVMHSGDEDRRKGLQAQGVSAAGIVKESYDNDMLDKLPIPPVVQTLLVDFYEYASPIHVIDVDRDEDEDVDTDATEF